MNEKDRIIALVRQAKLGDAHSFARLYELYYQELYKAALYTLGKPEDAENVVSDTVLDAYAGISRLRDEAAFRGWIFRILSNKCKRYVRDIIRKRETEYGIPIEDMAEGYPAADHSIEDAENKTVISDAFSVLTSEERQIVSMTIYGEYDSGEIAEQMGLNRNTVRSKYSRALVKMRRKLGGQSAQGY